MFAERPRGACGRDGHSIREKRLGIVYIRKTEIPAAMALHGEGKIKVVPIVLESCRWEQTELGTLLALPDKVKAINKWSQRADGWKLIADGLAEVCKGLMESDARVTKGGRRGARSGE